MLFYDDHPGEISSAGSVNFMYKVYMWMCAALLITAVTSFFVLSTPSVKVFIFKPAVMFGLSIGSLILAIALQAMIRQMSLTTALALFFLYAVMLGMMLSSIFMVFTQTSIYATFVVAAGMFGIMALYGAFTKTDLSTIGSYATMALFGIIIAMIVNIFLQSSQFDFLISFVGVAVFVLLTAADTQKIRQLGNQLVMDRQTIEKVALLCALTLYLDFINLFLFLLRIMGKRRD